MTQKRKRMEEEPSLEEQGRLIEIMNDSPRLVSLAGTQWEIRALKPGTQWLIAEEAVKVDKAESANFGDVVKQFAVNTPSVCKVLTLALLNDRRRIYANGIDGEFSEEYKSVYNALMWDTDQGHWMSLFVEVVQMLDVELFFSLTSSIRILRQRLLERKKTTEEQRQLSLAQSGGR